MLILDHIDKLAGFGAGQGGLAPQMSGLAILEILAMSPSQTLNYRFKYCPSTAQRSHRPGGLHNFARPCSTRRPDPTECRNYPAIQFGGTALCYILLANRRACSLAESNATLKLAQASQRITVSGGGKMTESIYQPRRLLAYPFLNIVSRCMHGVGRVLSCESLRRLPTWAFVKHARMRLCRGNAE